MNFYHTFIATALIGCLPVLRADDYITGQFFYNQDQVQTKQALINKYKNDPPAPGLAFP